MINNSARTAKIEHLLNTALHPTTLQVIDDSAAHAGHAGHAGTAGGAGHFTVIISSAAFQGKSLIEQHQLVYQALAEMLPDEIHALSIKTF
jgi:BolA family transcriptional regulator, general stress-responsive regulator